MGCPCFAVRWQVHSLCWPITRSTVQSSQQLCFCNYMIAFENLISSFRSSPCSWKQTKNNQEKEKHIYRLKSHYYAQISTLNRWMFFQESFVTTETFQFGQRHEFCTDMRQRTLQDALYLSPNHEQHLGASQLGGSSLPFLKEITWTTIVSFSSDCFELRIKLQIMMLINFTWYLTNLSRLLFATVLHGMVYMVCVCGVVGMCMGGGWGGGDGCRSRTWISSEAPHTKGMNFSETAGFCNLKCTRWHWRQPFLVWSNHSYLLISRGKH